MEMVPGLFNIMLNSYFCSFNKNNVRYISHRKRDLFLLTDWGYSCDSVMCFQNLPKYTNNSEHERYIVFIIRVKQAEFTERCSFL